MKIWTFSSMQEVIGCLAPIMAQNDSLMSGGVSKGLQTKSRTWVRVLETVISAEFSWVASSAGTDRSFVNFMYILLDETGELHFPKDDNRRESSFSVSRVQSFREQILRDVQILSKQKAPMSAGWYTQLGQPVKAMEVRAIQANLALMQRAESASTSSSAPEASGNSYPHGKHARRKTTRRHADQFEVEAVVEEELRGGVRGMWIRWAGYAPEWEAWRAEGRGAVGGLLVTWEPERNLKNIEAYVRWKEAA